MNKPNFIIKENVYDTQEEYEEFIQDYKNPQKTVKQLQRKYGTSKYKRLFDKAVLEEKIIPKRRKYLKRKTGIKNVTITQNKEEYIWKYYYKNKTITSKYLNHLQKRIQEKGYSWEVTDPEQLERIKRKYNVQ